MARSLVVPAPATVIDASGPSAIPGRRNRALDCERLDVFRVAVEFQVLASAVCSHGRLGALRGPLDRASVSIVLNISEGAGHFAPAAKASFYTIARASAMECLGALELLARRSLVACDAHRRGRSLLARVVAMLTRLIVAMARARKA